MAATTFNGPVRSENGFEQISIASGTGAITTNLDVDSSGNIETTGTAIFLKPYTSITDSTYTVTSAMSGTTFGLNAAGGIVVTLPTAAAVFITSSLWARPSRPLVRSTRQRLMSCIPGSR